MSKLRDAGQPTPHLRFVERDGKRILQQWFINSYMSVGDGYANALNWWGEWRDIELKGEADEQA